ncbi:uncharacterized protein [Tenebrio molitor]|uniref:uncharacterized protein isoform X2 n=1 Tax=Tenebrio molitor TaxID=7067 RepID=UPI0036247DEC
MALMPDADFEGDFLEVQENIRGIANAASAVLLPLRSKERYEKQYAIFCEWRKAKGANGSEKYKPSSLWAFYSMLKKTLISYENVNIADFSKVSSFLKTKSLGYVPKKSADLNRAEVETFLKEAPNEEFLLVKAVTIFGVCGGCRRQELCDVKVQHVKDEGAVIVVRIPDTKTHVSRAFTILSDGNGFNPIDLVRQYMKLRPSHTKIDRFFLSYRNKKCTVQPVGIKTIGKFPSIIAKYLGLENAASYTGHCYRRTSATLLANAGADVLTLKRHGSWKSSTVAENYVAESMCNKIKIAKMIQCGDGIETNSNISNKENETPVVSVSNKNISLEIESNNQKMIAGNLQMTFEKKSKCVINVYNSKN